MNNVIIEAHFCKFQQKLSMVVGNRLLEKRVKGIDYIEDREWITYDNVEWKDLIYLKWNHTSTKLQLNEFATVYLNVLLFITLHSFTSGKAKLNMMLLNGNESLCVEMLLSAWLAGIVTLMFTSR